MNIEDQALNTEIATQIVDAPVIVPEVETEKPDPAKPTMREQLEASHKQVMDRPRDDAGRFAQKQAADAAQALAPPVTAEIKPIKVERPADMPKAWGADKSAQWASLTPEAKAYITDRETQMEGFHTKFSGLKDWHEAAAANNTTLPEVLQRVNEVETAMIQNPSHGFIKAAEMVGLSREDTARSLVGALQALGYNIPGVQASQQQAPAYNTEIKGLEQRIAAFENEQNTQKLNTAQQSVEAFFADPANTHAKDLQAEIANELKAMRAIGMPMDLKQAYDRAMWTRPELRERLVTEQFAAKQAALTKTNSQELEKARSASRSVAGSPPMADSRANGDKPIPLRAQLQQQLAAKMGRV